MKGKTILFLVLWGLIALDALSTVVCRFIPSCQSFAQRIPIGKSFGLDTPWIYVYLGLAVFGFLTVFMTAPKKKEAYQSPQEQYPSDSLPNKQKEPSFIMH